MRARNLKPSIYKNEALGLLGGDAFRLFTGLWCMADRQGRLKDEPGKIEAEVFPFKFQRINIHELMDGLAAGEDPFITRYSANGKNYVSICKFLEHQRPHPKEVQSAIPPCKRKFIPRLYPEHTQDTPNPSIPSLSSDVQYPPIPDIAHPRQLTPVVQENRREYRIPEPKENPTAALVMYYKAVLKQTPYADRTWDKKHWSRTSKAAADLLSICGSYEAARACLDKVSDDLKDKSWTFETIVRWAHEWKAKQGGKDYGATNSASFFSAVAKQRSKTKFEGLRKSSSPGEILDVVRNMQKLSHPPGEGDDGTTGKPDDQSLAGIRKEALETTPDRGEAS